jgi:tetratricopeptide (TPR) repeat protein
MRDRISLRLVDLAGKTGKFDAAAEGYISLVGSNPTLAATVKPTLPADADPKMLAGIVSDTDKALGDSKLTPSQKATLLQFELELQTAMGDKKAAAATVEQILKSGALNGDDPASKKLYGDLKVTVAQAALDAKQYAKAVSQIDEARASLTDPHQQVSALWILAESKYQQALAKPPTDKTGWQDIAIAFMRVVANFPDKPQAASALERTAACYEQMKQPDKAVTVYQQVVKQYPKSPAAKTAQDAITRLQPGK